MCIPYPSPSWDGLTDLIMIVSKSWLGQGLLGKFGYEEWFCFVPKKAENADWVFQPSVCLFDNKLSNLYNGWTIKVAWSETPLNECPKRLEFPVFNY